MVESFVDEVASNDEGSQDQLTHNVMDKRGHDVHDLEALQNLSFFHFTHSTAFFLL